ATAAGIAGVIKVIFALKHKQLPPTINFDRLNEHIDLTDSPFYVNSRLQEWTRDAVEKRQAAISSFGFSGTNAHMVIGEYVPPLAIAAPVVAVTQDSKTIVPLSARTAEQLKQRARDLLDFLRGAQPVDLIELAYTLQVGREPMEERLGFMASSVEQLAEQLEAYVDERPEIDGAHRGHVKRTRDGINVINDDDDVKVAIVGQCVASRKLSKLLELWVEGLDFDWTRLYGDVKPRRTSLPTYPFAKERYWIDATTAGGAGNAVLHPLLHNNTSDLSEQRYSSTFTGNEFFLADHRMRTDDRTVHKILPGAAYLEMARAAIERASPLQPTSRVLDLRNTVWLKPAIVREPQQISIAVFAKENDQLGYEIYSREADRQTIHCQGEAVFRHRSE